MNGQTNQTMADLEFVAGHSQFFFLFVCLFGIYVLILYGVSFSFRLEFYCDLCKRGFTCKRSLDRHFESIKH